MSNLPSVPKRKKNGFPGYTELWVRLESFLSMRSPATYSTYKGILNEWSRFLGAELGSDESAKQLTSATDLNAMAYIRWLGQQAGERPRLMRRNSGSARTTAPMKVNQAHKTKKVGLEHYQSNATIGKKLAALRRIYRMLISAGLVSTGNPFDSDKIKAPPKESGRKRPTEMVPFEKVKAIIEHSAGTSPKELHDSAILACLFGGALRRSEVAALRLADVRKSAAGTAYLYLRATKAGKDAQQALPAWAARTILRYMKERVQFGAGPSDFLFCSFRGKGGCTMTMNGISNAGIYKVFKSSCRKAGVVGFFTPHSARATAITKLLADGIPHRQVQEFSRHSSIQMVELYDKRRIGVDENVAKDLDFD
ncbi:MAG: site-specific integrase [Deltaproteobacteria bacterium]|nr:site-specific integrase [Deltaproteobacteria bacterium]